MRRASCLVRTCRLLDESFTVKGLSHSQQATLQFRTLTSATNSQQVSCTDDLPLSAAHRHTRSQDLRTAHHSQGQRTVFNLPDESKKYSERKLIGYSPQQLYTVVAGIEHYKDFVPWYTSKVTLYKPDKVFSTVEDSTLFDHLDSTWEFHKGPTPTTTWLTFGVDFAFKSPLYKHVANVFFDEVVKRMMHAFESRCQALYGPSNGQRPIQRRPLPA